MAIWDKSVLGFSATFIRKLAVPYSLPEVPKMIIVETRTFCLVVWFLNLAIWNSKEHMVSKCELSNGNRATWDNLPFGTHLGSSSLRCFCACFSLNFFPLLSLKELSGLDLKPLFPWSRELISGTNNPVHYAWWAF